MSDSNQAPTRSAAPPETAPGWAGLHLAQSHLAEVIADCSGTYPEEGCGLLAGDPATGTVTAVHPTVNLAASARLYEVDPGEYLRIDRAAEADGRAVIGVFHSHTNTDPYPSPTDVAQAPDPAWHYVVVSLRDEVASVCSYRIVDGLITREAIRVTGS